MTDRNPGLIAEPLFVGVTRPPMRFGVTFTALLLNVVVTMEVFVLTRNLATLLLALPVHGLSQLLCARDARFFELLWLWARARAPVLLGTLRYFRASSAGPLSAPASPGSGRVSRPVQVCL